MPEAQSRYHGSVTLDHIEGYHLTPEQTAPIYWELQTLDCLWHGLDFLHESVRAIEEAKAFGAKPFGPLFRDDGEPKRAGRWSVPLIVCYFHWYAVSACNYVRIVGRLAKEAGLSKLQPVQYVEAVVPDVKLWRDKIAAHAAFADPRREDIGAMESLSVVPHLYSTSAGLIEIMQIEVTQTTASGDTSSAAVRPWGITRVHDALSRRYRPAETGDSDGPA